MLRIEVPDQDYFDEDVNEFVDVKGQTLLLEHSLISISKWEMKWHEPFLGDKEHTPEQTTDYVRCMCICPVHDEKIFSHLPPEVIERVNAYISDPMTATWFVSKRGGSHRAPSRDVITNELVYYWMIAYNIPFDPCEKWHFARLMTLIRVCQNKSETPKKMSKRELASRNAALNAQRKAKLNTKG